MNEWMNEWAAKNEKWNESAFTIIDAIYITCVSISVNSSSNYKKIIISFPPSHCALFSLNFYFFRIVIIQTKVSLIYDAVFVFAIGLQTLQHSSKIALSNVNVSCKDEKALHLGSSLINFINTVCILLLYSYPTLLTLPSRLLLSCKS